MSPGAYEEMLVPPLATERTPAVSERAIPKEEVAKYEGRLVERERERTDPLVEVASLVKEF